MKPLKCLLESILFAGCSLDHLILIEDKYVVPQHSSSKKNASKNNCQQEDRRTRQLVQLCEENSTNAIQKFPNPSHEAHFLSSTFASHFQALKRLFRATATETEEVIT